MLTWDSVERGFEWFLDLVGRDARLQAEFERSRGDFFADATAPRAPGAERRHLEWFLLERPSSVLGAVPVQAWQERFLASFPGAPAELAVTFAQSLPGAFEITSVVPGEGLWVRDLFTQGEHPIAEAQATATLAVGDLLVGRLFPAGGGTFMLSPAVSVFRNMDLLAAVRVDLEAMRAVRRGVLRVQQLELERLFHSQAAAAVDVPPAAEVRERARAAMTLLGLTEKEADGVLRRVQRAARAGDGRVVIEVLNDLAFETGIDLSSARLVLTELWERERLEHVPAVSDPEPAGTADARAALKAFDRGRAEGKDLELLFHQLERALGVEGEDEESEAAEEVVPDFPGVVGAMIEEFLWDVGREQGEERARTWSILRALGNYGQDIGVFEELDHVRLLDFSARWVLDESALKQVAEAETMLEALESFCRWCEERHAHPLWNRFGPTLTALRDSLPRHVALRQESAAGPGAGAYRVVRVDPDRVLVRDAGGSEQTVMISPFQAQHLRDGDLVRLDRRRNGPVLGASYPGELASLLAKG